MKSVESLPWKNCTQIPLEKWDGDFRAFCFLGASFGPVFGGEMFGFRDA